MPLTNVLPYFVVAGGGGGGTGLFTNGLPAGYTNYVDKYNFSDDTVSVGTVMPLALDYACAASNTTDYISFGGYTGAIREEIFKYLYATDVVSTQVDIVGNGNGLYVAAATGNSTVGIVVGGDDGGFSAVPSGAFKYTYSSEVVISTTGSPGGLSINSQTGVGNSTVGMFAGGFSAAVVANVDKYTYAGDTFVDATALGLARYYLAGTGTDTVGIIGGGTPSTAYTDKYTYAGDVVSVGTVLSVAKFGLAAGGDSTVGIFAGGYDGAVTAATSKYTYSVDSVSVGTSLGLARRYLAGGSNSNGGVQ